MQESRVVSPADNEGGPVLDGCRLSGVLICSRSARGGAQGSNTESLGSSWRPGCRTKMAELGHVGSIRSHIPSTVMRRARVPWDEPVSLANGQPIGSTERNKARVFMKIRSSRAGSPLMSWIPGVELCGAHDGDESSVRALFVPGTGAVAHFG